MSVHHKKVSDLKAEQIEIDPKSRWAKLPMIGGGLALLGFALGFFGPNPGGAFAEELKETKDVARAEEKIFGKTRKNLKNLEGQWKAYTLQVKLEAEPQPRT